MVFESERWIPGSELKRTSFSSQTFHTKLKSLGKTALPSSVPDTHRALLAMSMASDKRGLHTFVVPPERCISTPEEQLLEDLVGEEENNHQQLLGSVFAKEFLLVQTDVLGIKTLPLIECM